MKTIFITGASSGMGKATAKFFAQNGWNVVATMRKPEQESELNGIPNIFITELDVTKPETIENAINKGLEKFGKIDVLLNNAGYGQVGTFESLTPDAIRAIFEVNVFGVMNVTRAFLPYFRQKKGGLIVTVTSAVSKVYFPLVSVYTATKAAVEGFLDSVSYELDSQNICLKIIEPGSVDTNFQKRAFEAIESQQSIPDYDTFMAEINALYSGWDSVEIASVEDVAKTIYSAVNDVTSQFRYVVGPDIAPMIEAKSGKTDQQYSEFLRSIFSKNGFKTN